MSWNEPGGQDPWGDRGRNSQGPPDLDEIIRKARQRLRGWFGGGGPGGGRGSGSGSGGGAAGIGVIVGLVVAIWLLYGFYIVDSAERGLVLRFGKYVETTMPGLHWHLPWPIETVEEVNVAQVRRFNHATQMLTADENIVSIDMTVQYRVDDAQAFVFNVRQPDLTLSEASKSAIREVVGKAKMDFVLGEGRAEIAERTKQLLQQVLTSYEAGIELTSVALQDAQPPEPVQDAFEDAIRAREDKEKLILQAEGYANDVLPRARGAGARRVEEAEGYREEVVSRAEGDTARFTQVLSEYQQAPEVTRERIYLETMQDVMGRTGKVLMDVEGSGNMVYLPIDKLLEHRARRSRSDEAGAAGSGSQGDSGGEPSGSGGTNPARDRTRGSIR